MKIVDFVSGHPSSCETLSRDLCLRSMPYLSVINQPLISFLPSLPSPTHALQRINVVENRKLHVSSSSIPQLGLIIITSEPRLSESLSVSPSSSSSPSSSNAVSKVPVVRCRFVGGMVGCWIGDAAVSERRGAASLGSESELWLSDSSRSDGV